MRPYALALLVLASLATGYFFWSLFVSSRYQALCNLNYWSATKEEIEGCREAETELEKRR